MFAARTLLFITAATALAWPAMAQDASGTGATGTQAAGTQAAGTQAADAQAIARETEVEPPADAQADAAAAAELAPEPAVAASASSPDADLRSEAAEYFKPIPRLAELPDGRPMTRAKIDLGAMLFFDPRMSLSGLFSCQSCHNVGMGGTDALETSIGHGWQAGPRNSPTMLNAIFNVAQFWDGRAEDLAAQAKGPVQAGVEMNNTPENLIATIESMPGYVSAFEDAFPGEAEPISFDNFAHAIEAFEATLVTPNSPFDQWLMGTDGAMTDQEKRGLQAFMESGCAACHAGVNFGGEGYYPFGLVEAPADEVRPEGDVGRFSVTNTEDDEYVFRAAPLRNVALTAPYFHSGKVWDLQDAVQIMATSQLGTELSDEQLADITAFLGTLTGEQPQIVHPLLPVRTVSTPEPMPMEVTPDAARGASPKDANEADDPARAATAPSGHAGAADPAQADDAAGDAANDQTQNGQAESGQAEEPASQTN